MHGPINVKFFVYIIIAIELFKSSSSSYHYNIKIILMFVIIYKPGLNKIKI
jgi:hypothetical protein